MGEDAFVAGGGSANAAPPKFNIASAAKHARRFIRVLPKPFLA
jgi:hypothetical protein